MLMNNINKTVRCMTTRKDLTVGFIYEVLNEGKEYYLLTNDEYDKHLYPKDLFEVIEHSTFEIAYNDYEELLEEVAIN